MRRSDQRILCSHVGALPIPDESEDLFDDRTTEVDEYERALPAAVGAVVRHQVDIGVDAVSDGELAKRQGFQHYIAARLGGIERRDSAPGAARRDAGIHGRDHRDFPAYYAELARQPVRARSGGGGPGAGRFVCTSALSYVGHHAAHRDAERLRAAVGVAEVDAFVPAISPGNVEHWLVNEHYEDDESFLFAIADALHEEYRAIADAGLIVQVDDPDLADGWQMFPDMDLDAYLRYAEVRIEALNQALAGIDPEQVRLHVCWGSGKGPHANDLGLRDVVALMLKARAGCYAIEAANARHEHEWAVWEDVLLPDDKVLMPGVITHHTDHVEHPELVAWRLRLYANLIGRERLIAGTDCGMVRAAPSELCWAKLESLVRGA